MSTMGLAVRVTRVTRAAEASRSLWWDVSKEPCCTSPYCWCLRTYVRKEDEIASKFRNGNKVRQRRASTEGRKFGVADGNSRRERCRSDVASSVRPSSPPLAIKRMRYSANPFCGSHTSGLEAPRLICGKSRSQTRGGHARLDFRPRPLHTMGSGGPVTASLVSPRGSIYATALPPRMR